MPWVPVKYALRRLRESRGWSLADLVDKSGVSERQLNSLESRTPPSFVRATTADYVSAVFGLKLNEWKKWKPDDRWLLWISHGKEDIGADEVDLPPMGTIARLAKMERDLGLQTAVVQTPRGAQELLGIDRLHKCFTQPKVYDGKRFVISGKVDQHTSLPSSAAKKIGAAEDEGAVYRISRAVARRLPLYVTVFAAKARHSQILMDAHDAETNISLVARVAYAPAAGAWRGFFIFEEPPKARKFAFVVEEIVTEPT